MTHPEFLDLSQRQRHAMVIAMQVRNALEDFHVKHLSDAQMRVLNQTIRYAIYDAVQLMETMEGDASKMGYFEWLVNMIPSYWEIPGRDERTDIDSTAGKRAA